jgi:glycosyltransferase involved in cell wall biosynthesis
LLRVLVEHDVTFVAAARGRALVEGAFRRALLWLDEQKVFRHEVLAVRGADVAITMSEEDRNALAPFVDPSRLRIVPNGVSCADFPFAPEASEPEAVLFVGFFRHSPNIEAVLWFADEVLPRVRGSSPGVRFLVVGAYPPPALEDLARTHPEVEIAGRVPETASYYRRAAVFVAPILRGSGTRLKILEAMASGTAVVSTTIGAEGLGAPPDTIRIADDAPRFADAVAGLLADRAKRLRMAVRARAFVEERFDWDVIGRRQLEAWGLRVPPERESAEPGPAGEESGPPLRGVG